MPEHLRALIVLVVLAYLGFALLMPSAKELGFQREIKTWRLWWYAVTVSAFIVSSYWVFIFLSMTALALYRASSINKLAVFCLLLLTLPSLPNEIPGFGLVNYFIRLSWPMLLTLFLLLPIFVGSGRSSTVKRDKNIFDQLVLAYFVYISLLAFRDTSLTDGLRNVLYFSLGIYLPYKIFSTHITSKRRFLSIQFAVFSVIILVSLFAIFESLKSWQLYSELKDILGNTNAITDYKHRVGSLRPNVTLGAINVGLFITIAFAFGVSLFNDWKATKINLLYISILGLALLLTLSRGPWLGMFVMIVIYIVISSNRVRNLSRFAASFVILVPLLIFSGEGTRLVNLLPGVDNNQNSTISYRQRLLSTSIDVINENPLIGSTTYLENPKMRTLIQGEGIIDIVNTYIQIALEYGYIGVALFMSIFLGIAYNLLRLIIMLRRKKRHDLELIGISLLLSLSSVLFIIGTVSTLGGGAVSIFYWLLAGLSVAYIRMAKNSLITNQPIGKELIG